MAPISAMNDPFSTLHHHNPNYMHPSQGLYVGIAQVENGDANNVYNYNNVIFGGDRFVSMEGHHLFDIPPLETKNTTEEKSIESLVEFRSGSNKNIVHNIVLNQCSKNINNIKVENEEGFGGYWEDEQELRVEEEYWDLEELMKDVPSFPFLDFQVQ